MGISQGELKSYLVSAIACLATAFLAALIRPWFDTVNIVMLFLLAVFLVSWRLGQGPAVLAAFLSVGLFDFFFVPPRLTFAVADIQYLLTFVVMLAVALITGQLTALLRKQAEAAQQEEARTRALYETAKSLAGAVKLPQVAETVAAFLHNEIDADCMLLLPDDTGQLQAQGSGRVWIEPHLAQAVYDRGQSGEEADGVRYLPLIGATRVRGVLAISPVASGNDMLNQPMLEAVATLSAIAVERLHYVEVAQQAQLQTASERLRSSVLSALSHDLRTPLTILVGIADSLARSHLEARQKEDAEAVRDQAMRLAGLVENLLDMARLHAGDIQLRREWQPLEEVIGSSLKLLGRALGRHPVRIELPADLPLLEFDAVLMERVFCNLLENASKYSPEDSPIDITANRKAGLVEISVRDYGPGIAPERQDRIFEMFVRGVSESNQHGVGLGLAICRAIVDAHCGTIIAENCTPGARFTFTLPVGEPPVIEGDDLLESRQ
ncbi:MAG TPA: DUF4118 domain-containing protein [Methylophilaceae bacterium]|nr:DUF4118 domain-containing protein [Methylophilaceae bacterium]